MNTCAPNIGNVVRLQQQSCALPLHCDASDLLTDCILLEDRTGIIGKDPHRLLSAGPHELVPFDRPAASREGIHRRNGLVGDCVVLDGGVGRGVNDDPVLALGHCTIGEGQVPFLDLHLPDHGDPTQRARRGGRLDPLLKRYGLPVPHAFQMQALLCNLDAFIEHPGLDGHTVPDGRIGNAGRFTDGGDGGPAPDDIGPGPIRNFWFLGLFDLCLRFALVSSPLALCAFLLLLVGHDDFVTCVVLNLSAQY
mmetsp:Transcript_25443/g.43405  ORF Transcript_25443/g.43405 Transcript_25443/m.43405 type:complete len:251 (-) Transcript_25443:25-777(-)